MTRGSPEGTPAPGGDGATSEARRPTVEVPSFERQLMELEDQQASLRRRIATLESDMQDVDASVRAVLGLAWSGEDMGLTPDEIEEAQQLRAEIIAACDERTEASRHRTNLGLTAIRVSWKELAAAGAGGRLAYPSARSWLTGW